MTERFPLVSRRARVRAACVAVVALLASLSHAGEDPAQTLAAARKMLAAGKHAEALVAVRTLLNGEDSPAAFAQLVAAAAYEAQGQWTQAKTSAQRAFQLASVRTPEHEQAREALARILPLVAAKDPKQAAAAFRHLGVCRRKT